MQIIHISPSGPWKTNYLPTVYTDAILNANYYMNQPRQKYFLDTVIFSLILLPCISPSSNEDKMTVFYCPKTKYSVLNNKTWGETNLPNELLPVK